MSTCKYRIEILVIEPYVNGYKEKEIEDSLEYDVIGKEATFSKIYYLLSNRYPSRTLFTKMLRSNEFLDELINHIQHTRRG